MNCELLVTGIFFEVCRDNVLVRLQGWRLRNALVAEFSRTHRYAAESAAEMVPLVVTPSATN